MIFSYSARDEYGKLVAGKIKAPSRETAISLLQKFSELVASEMKKNKDDELFRRNGTLLRDVIPAYDILRTYESENDFIKTNIGIIPLPASNHLGEQTKKIQLD